MRRLPAIDSLMTDYGFEVEMALQAWRPVLQSLQPQVDAAARAAADRDDGEIEMDQEDGEIPVRLPRILVVLTFILCVIVAVPGGK